MLLLFVSVAIVFVSVIVIRILVFAIATALDICTMFVVRAGSVCVLVVLII